MIIECDKCHARFKIADSKVKPQGVRVRCKRCQNIFVVRRPEEEAKETVEDLGIEELVREETREGPESTEGPLQGGEEDLVWPGTEAEAGVSEEEKGSSEEEFHFPSHPSEEAGARETEGVGGKEEAQWTEEESKKEREEPVEEREGISSWSMPSPRKRVALVGLLILLLVVLGLVTAARMGMLNRWLPGPTGEEVKEAPSVNRELLGQLKGYYVLNGKEGVIFVVEGTVTNPKDVEFSLRRVRVTILDKNGRPFQERLILLGKVIPREELSRLSRAEIEERLRRGTRTLGPRSSLPFMTVFYRVPTDLSEFVVEVEE